MSDLCTPVRGFVGEKVGLYYSLQASTTSVENLVFNRLGMLTEKASELTIGDIDVTGDTSPENYFEFISGRKEGTISGTYVKMGTDIEGQREFERTIEVGNANDCGTSSVWFQRLYPDGTKKIGYYMVNSLSESQPTNDKVTVAFSAKLSGGLTIIDPTP